MGPDAGVEDSLRGPVGMGEFNAATKAGFYGWPYSRGNNQMYIDYDFDRKVSKEIFKPDNTISSSDRFVFTPQGCPDQCPLSGKHCAG